MTTLLLPVKYHVDRTKMFLSSLRTTNARPRQMVIIVDNDPELAKLDYDLSGVNVLVINNDTTLEYWNSLNRGLGLISDREPFVYLGNDVLFDPDWLDRAYDCWNFPDGLGLMSFYDGIHGDFNASHGMTTKAWLEVVFGEPNFPREYSHYYCDSELTVRSKDLGRYTYCAASRVLHDTDGKTRYEAKGDYIVKERRHVEWVNGGKIEAQRRLKQLVNA